MTESLHYSELMDLPPRYADAGGCIHYDPGRVRWYEGLMAQGWTVDAIRRAYVQGNLDHASLLVAEHRHEHTERET